MSISGATLNLASAEQSEGGWVSNEQSTARRAALLYPADSSPTFTPKSSRIPPLPTTIPSLPSRVSTPSPHRSQSDAFKTSDNCHHPWVLRAPEPPSGLASMSSLPTGAPCPAPPTLTAPAPPVASPGPRPHTAGLRHPLQVSALTSPKTHISCHTYTLSLWSPYTVLFFFYALIDTSHVSFSPLLPKLPLPPTSTNTAKHEFL